MYALSNLLRGLFSVGMSPPAPFTICVVLDALARCLSESGRGAEAIPCFERRSRAASTSERTSHTSISFDCSWARRRRLFSLTLCAPSLRPRLGPNHLLVADLRMSYAKTLGQLGKLYEAEEQLNLAAIFFRRVR